MRSKHEFTVSICTEYTSKEIKIELIAKYDYFPASKGSIDECGQKNEPDCDEELEISCVVAKNVSNMLDFMVARAINDTRDFDHLETDILESMK